MCDRTFSINFFSENTNLEYRNFLLIWSRRPSIGRQALWGATITIFVIEICLTIDFFQTIDANLFIKYSLVLDNFLSLIEIYLSNIYHHELNTNKSINRKIAIILTAKFDRKMSKEIFAENIAKIANNRSQELWCHFYPMMYQQIWSITGCTWYQCSQVD